LAHFALLLRAIGVKLYHYPVKRSPGVGIGRLVSAFGELCGYCVRKPFGRRKLLAVQWFRPENGMIPDRYIGSATVGLGAAGTIHPPGDELRARPGQR
jgi:hypothetical protein